MITRLRLVLFPFFLFGIAWQARAAAPGALDCRVESVAVASRSLRIACRADALPPGRRSLRFLDQYAGIAELSDRLASLRIREAGGGPALLPEIRGNGLYVVQARGPIEFSYEMRLARAYEAGQHALVSSLGPEAAVLLPNDLVPRLCDGEGACDGEMPAMRLRVDAPSGWRVGTTEPRQGDGYALARPERAVLVLGRLETRQVDLGGAALDVAVAGAWRFTPEELAAAAGALAREQAALMTGNAGPPGRFLLTLLPFPQPMTGLQSSGVAVGRTVVLMLNPDEDRARTFAHLRRHLAHELFHFYLPNALLVRENFDWFWEGFTRYLALLTLARLRLLTQREVLDAVGAEYQAYAANPARARVSLIDASPGKFADPAYSDLVYRKGMLVAALYDWELRWQSRNRRTLFDVVRALHQAYGDGARPVGNREVLAALAAPGEFARQLREDLEGTAEIALEKRLKPYGLLLEWNAATKWKPRLSPAPKLSDRQRDWLAGLTSEN